MAFWEDRSPNVNANWRTKRSRGSLVALRGGSDTDTLRGSEAYYLVWSPRFVSKLALATTLLALFRYLQLDRLFVERYLQLDLVVESLRRSSVPLGGLFPNVVLPLLSSSCCAIQLAVNAISVAMGAGAGCIGFNTVLGPLRPYLLATMVAYHSPLAVSSPSTTVLRYGIALLPEIVFGWNQLLRSQWRKKAQSSTNTVGTQQIQATLVVEVPTMGCVACVNKIESSLRNAAPNEIETATSWLNPKESATEGKKKGGKAKIQVKVSSSEQLDDLAQSLVGAIEDAGFQGSTIEKLEIQE